MSIADQLAAVPIVTEPEHRPRVVFDGVSGYVQTPARPDGQPPHDWTEMLREAGLDPNAVRAVGHPRVSRWQRYDGQWLTAYRFQLAPATGADPDIDSLLAEIRDYTPGTPAATTGDGVFVFQVSDLQVGKIDGDGLDGTLGRFFASVDRATAEFDATRDRHGIGAVHLIFAGDCLENGAVVQDGRLAARQSHTVTEQFRIWRRTLLSTIKVFAPRAARVHVSVVGGNHDDATRHPVHTRADDNWATEGAHAVRDALAENPEAFGHITIHTPPPDRGYMTVKVADSIFTIAHGHQWRRGKAAEWWASQAFYGQNPAAAHFLCHGHWHSTSITQDGPRTIVCSPTYDGGSAWYHERTGAVCRQGGLVYITHAAEFTNLTLV
ncbi:metallophosphoesterase family protein [Nocardia transvalensis]|uniref:metallophosphoesterase family protein n=1 Tax=Nocardia transvalensis TaxID=37333 RepID=UPI0018934E28|nr:metallophosphoesterase family protein [Nocardia transvalensis]MBF6332455.1 metallophosphoesterase family protein [Nocardia transvalensis]